MKKNWWFSVLLRPEAGIAIGERFRGAYLRRKGSNLQQITNQTIFCPYIIIAIILMVEVFGYLTNYLITHYKKIISAILITNIKNQSSLL